MQMNLTVGWARDQRDPGHGIGNKLEQTTKFALSFTSIHPCLIYNYRFTYSYYQGLVKLQGPSEIKRPSFSSIASVNCNDNKEGMEVGRILLGEVMSNESFVTMSVHLCIRSIFIVRLYHYTRGYSPFVDQGTFLLGQGTLLLSLFLLTFMLHLLVIHCFCNTKPGGNNMLIFLVSEATSI